MQYAIKISSESKTLYSEPITAAQMNYLRTELPKDESISKISFYFPRTSQSMKIQNFINKIFSTIKAFFLDLITLPFNYQSYRAAFRKKLLIYHYLEERGVPSKYLNTDSFRISFLSRNIDEEGKNNIEENFGYISVNSHIGLKSKIIEGHIGGTHGSIGVVSEAIDKLFSEKFCIQ